MANRPGLFTQMWHGIRKGFYVARSVERFVGEDYLGNRYYEIIKDTTKGIRGSRFVKGVANDEFEVPKVPHEWNSWLRKNRDDPPSQEELDRNYALAMHKQIKGRELELKREEESRQGAAEGLIHRMKKGDSEKENDFPVYTEYEEFPGDEKPGSGPGR